MNLRLSSRLCLPIFANLLAFFFTFKNSVLAQPVASSCDGASNLVAKFNADAYQIALQRLEMLQANQLNSVEIDDMTRDSVLRAMFAVYNTDSAVRDTVFDLFNIHAYQKRDLHRVEVLLDTSFSWTKKWIDYEAISGNSFLDLLVNTYGLEVENVVMLPEWVNYDAKVTLKTSKFINGNFLAELISTSTGVRFAYGLSYGGDGDHVFFEKMADWIEITFRHGWSNCPTGCDFHRDWLFKVHPDCSVEFVSSYGDSLGSFTPVREVALEGTKIFPVPASDFVEIQANDLPSERLEILFSNELGQVLKIQQVEAFGSRYEGLFDLSDQTDGIYFLTLSAQNQRVVHKIVKKK